MEKNTKAKEAPLQSCFISIRPNVEKTVLAR